MFRFSILGLFLLRFALVYGVLILPWPNSKEVYSSYIQILGNIAFGSNTDKRVVQFKPNHDPGWPPNFDTLIGISNPGYVGPDGRTHKINLAFDAKQLGWIPTAWFLALVIATPVSWKRRIYAIVWGFPCTQAFILFSIGVYIWNESTRVGLVEISPFWKSLAEDVENTVIAPMGITLFVPVLIWMVLIFRRKDMALVTSLLTPTQATSDDEDSSA